jgi:hypothetical protein
MDVKEKTAVAVKTAAVENSFSRMKRVQGDVACTPDIFQADLFRGNPICYSDFQ